MVRKLKRIAPLKFGITVGLIYGLISLVFIPFFILGFLLSLMAPHHEGAGAAVFGVVFVITFAVLAPIFYGVLGFIFGALGALIYNVVAKWTGGIEFEVE